MTQDLLEHYRAMVQAGEIAADPMQALAAEKLQLLANRLARYTPPAKTDVFSFSPVGAAKSRAGFTCSGRSAAARRC